MKSFYQELGARIRLNRKKVGLSQQKLASILGVTFQQVQKYEKGTNRIPVDVLVLCAQAFDVHISYLIGELTPIEHSFLPGDDSSDDNMELAALAGELQKLSPTEIRRMLYIMRMSATNKEKRIGLSMILDFEALPEEYQENVIYLVRALKDAQSFRKARFDPLW